MIYGHGDDTFSLNALKANFSSNVYSHDNFNELLTYLKGELASIVSYPEPNATRLQHKIAHYHSISSQDILVTNGATEAIYLIAQAYRDKETAILIPTFSEYQDACTIHNHKIHYVDSLSLLTEKLNERSCDLAWICNPNNPTGDFYGAPILKKLFALHPKTTFIIDTSYEHFMRREASSLLLYSENQNVIMLHSMTKHFSIPGLRLGYITADPLLIDRIMAYKMPWSVNQIAILAGCFLLDNDTKFAIPLQALHEETTYLQKNIANIKGFTPLKTHTHFFLVKMDEVKGYAYSLKAYLASKGILIRDAANFRGLTPYYFRLATQSRADNDLLLEALKEWEP